MRDTPIPKVTRNGSGPKLLKMHCKKLWSHLNIPDYAWLVICISLKDDIAAQENYLHFNTLISGTCMCIDDTATGFMEEHADLWMQFNNIVYCYAYIQYAVMTLT